MITKDEAKNLDKLIGSMLLDALFYAMDNAKEDNRKAKEQSVKALREYIDSLTEEESE